MLLFLECKTGYYGDDCSKKCDHCKNNASCISKSEECDIFGCAYPGYQPPSCKGTISTTQEKFHKQITKCSVLVEVIGQTWVKVCMI